MLYARRAMAITASPVPMADANASDSTGETTPTSPSTLAALPALRPAKSSAPAPAIKANNIASDTNAAPGVALQASLAALLNAIPAMPATPSAAPAPSVSNPTTNVAPPVAAPVALNNPLSIRPEIFNGPATPTQPIVNGATSELHVHQDPIPIPAPVPAGPVTDVPPPVGVPSTGPLAPLVTPSTSPQAAAIPGGTPTAPVTAAAPVIAPAQPAPLADASEPASSDDLTPSTAAAASVALPDDLTVSVKPASTEAVNFAGSTKTGAKTPPPPSATSAHAIGGDSLPVAVVANSQSPEDTDISLVPGPSTQVQAVRGTGGAKAVREMNEVPNTTANSAPTKPGAGLSAPASKTPVLGGSDDRAAANDHNSGQGSASNGDSNRGNAETFSFITAGSTISLKEPTAAPSVGGAELNVSQPMSAAAIVHEVGLGVERLQQHGSDRVDLNLSLEGGGQVSIQLQMRDGTVHASFSTGSPELRDALQQGWSQMASRSENLGVSLATPVFKAPPAATPNAGQQEYRGHREAPQQDQAPAQPRFAPSQQPKRPNGSTLSTRTASNGLSAWA